MKKTTQKPISKLGKKGKEFSLQFESDYNKSWIEFLWLMQQIEENASKTGEERREDKD